MNSSILADLAKSGLDETDYNLLKLRPHFLVNTATGKEFFSGYYLTYFGLDGEPIDFCRTKLLPPTKNSKGSDIRYLQPTGSIPKFYIPPYRDWTATAKYNEDIVFTEGEKKSAAACKKGLACVGLGGVWNFKRENRPIRDFNDFAWEDRKVKIVFDSDLKTNPDVRLAMDALARVLASRGAKVFFVFLPNDSEKKIGLDDFLLNHTIEEFHQLPIEEFVDPEKVDPRTVIDEWLRGESNDLTPIAYYLKKLSDISYDLLREDIAKKSGIRLKTLDAMRPIKKDDEEKNASVFFPDIEPWDKPVDGPKLLLEISEWLDKYVFLKPGHSKIIALYVFATHFIEVLFFAPILALLSPTMRCGKTTLLELLKHLVRRGFLSSGTGVTAAVLFRLNDSFQPTWLLDEAERLSGKDGDREIIGLLNAGYRRGATVQRCIGENFDVKNFNAHGFKIIAAIGRVWGTLEDRSITISMERKPEHIKKSRFVSREAEKEGGVLARKIIRFVEDSSGKILHHETIAPRPKELNDRACDNWSPLFAVAGMMGKAVLDEAVEQAKSLEMDEPAGLGEKLLADIASVFESLKNPPSISTSNLLDHLKLIEGGPWAEYRGKGLTSHNLAKILRPFDLGPLKLRNGKKTFQGWEYCDLKPVFDQYLTRKPFEEPEQPEHPEQLNNNNGFERSASEKCSGTNRNTESDRNTENPYKQASVLDVPVVLLPEKAITKDTTENDMLEDELEPFIDLED